MWISLYAGVTVVAAIAVFLLAEWLRTPSDPAPDNAGRYALIAVAALLWPVLVVGLAQWGLIAMVASRLRRSARADTSRQHPLESRAFWQTFGGVSADRGVHRGPTKARSA